MRLKFAALYLVGLALASAQIALTNEAIIKMVKAGLVKQFAGFIPPGQVMPVPDVVDTLAAGMKSISFQDLVPGSEGVRVTDDIPPLVWAVDLVLAVKGGTRSNAARDLNDIPDELFSTQKLIRKSMPGKGNSNAILVTFDHALELVMVLPGQVAKQFRVKACDILKRYMAGDASLVKEIEANAASNAPVNRLAKASITPVAKRACLAQPQDAMQAACNARKEHIYDTYQKYMEIQERVVDPTAKAAFSEMLLSNTQALLATPLVPAPDKPRQKDGYVYCFQSAGQPDVVKIGFTNNRKIRLGAVNRQRKREGINDPFVCRYSVRTLDAERDEKFAHAHFAAVRLPGVGELFRTTAESVRDFFERDIKPRYLKESGIGDYDASDVDMDTEDYDT